MLPSAVVGGTNPSSEITWYLDSEDIVKPVLQLSGATLSGTITHRDGTMRSITGTLSVVSGGIFRWTYSAADVSVPGVFNVRFIADFGSGIVSKSYQSEWEVLN